MTMTKEETNAFLNREYAEAIRYMENAKEALGKAGKDDRGLYNDAKYVRTACGTAYLGVLIAVEAWLTIRGANMPKPEKKNRSIEFYTFHVSRIDGAMLKDLNNAYAILHLAGYYRGATNVNTIKDGFDDAYTIIDRIKPDKIVEVKDTKIGAAKRAVRSFMMSMGLF